MQISMIPITSLIQAEFMHQHLRRAIAPQTELQSQPRTVPECRWRATVQYSTSIAGLSTAIYRHPHHDDHRQNCPGYFLNVDLGVCSSSNRLGQ